MVRKVSLLLVLSLMFSLVSCGDSKKEIKYFISDKYSISQETENAINEHLRELDAGYSVDFEVLSAENYLDNLKEKIAEGQVDVCFTGNELNDYTSLVQDGALLGLDEYLKTDEGKELYESVPLDNWYSVAVGQSVYCVNGSYYPGSTPPSYAVNTALMEKYDLTEADLRKPLYELEPILKKIYDAEKADGFSPVKIHLILTTEAINQFGISKSVQMDETTGLAHTLIDDAEYVKWLRCYYDYFKKGYLTLEEQINVNSFLINIALNTFVPSDSPAMGRYGDQSDLIQEMSLDGYAFYSTQNNYGTAVASNSKWQTEALDFLSKLFTDSHLSNLMVYGSGYEDILQDNGKLSQDGVTLNSLAYGNNYITAPLQFEPVDKKDQYFSFHQKIQKSRFTGFRPDLSQIGDKISEMDTIINEKWTELFTSETEQDIDIFLSDVRDALDKAGAQEVIDELNSQYKAFLAK